MQRTVTRISGEGRRKIADPALDLKSHAVQKFADPVGGAFLLESKLRLGMDPMAEVY
jgi:hypothetical protein